MRIPGYSGDPTDGGGSSGSSTDDDPDPADEFGEELGGDPVDSGGSSGGGSSSSSGSSSSGSSSGGSTSGGGLGGSIPGAPDDPTPDPEPEPLPDLDPEPEPDPADEFGEELGGDPVGSTPDPEPTPQPDPADEFGEELGGDPVGTSADPVDVGPGDADPPSSAGSALDRAIESSTGDPTRDPVSRFVGGTADAAFGTDSPGRGAVGPGIDFLDTRAQQIRAGVTDPIRNSDAEPTPGPAPGVGGLSAAADSSFVRDVSALGTEFLNPAAAGRDVLRVGRGAAQFGDFLVDEDGAGQATADVTVEAAQAAPGAAVDAGQFVANNPRQAAVTGTALVGTLGVGAAAGAATRGAARGASRALTDLDFEEFASANRGQLQRGGQRTPDNSGGGAGEFDVDMDELDDLLGNFERAERSRRVQDRVEERILERNRERARRQNPRQDEGLDPENRGDPSSSVDRQRFDPDRSAVTERGNFDTTRSGPRSTQQQQMDNLVRSQFNIDAGRTRSTSSGLDTADVDMSAADDVPDIDLRDVAPAPSTTGTSRTAGASAAGAGAAGVGATAELGELSSVNDPTGIADTDTRTGTATQNVDPINDPTGIDSGAGAFDLTPGRIGGGTRSDAAAGGSTALGELDAGNDPTGIADTGTGTNTGTGLDIGTGVDVGPGTDTPTDTGTDVGVGPGLDIGTGTEPVLDSGTDTPPGLTSPPISTPTTTPGTDPTPPTTRGPPTDRTPPGRDPTRPPTGTGTGPTPRRVTVPAPEFDNDEDEEERFRFGFDDETFTSATQSLDAVDDTLTEDLDDFGL